MRAVRGGILRSLASSSRVSGRSASFSNNPKSFAANKCLLIMKPAAVWRMRSGVVSFIWGLALPHRDIPACANGNEGGDLRQLAGKAELLQSLHLELGTYPVVSIHRESEKGCSRKPSGLEGTKRGSKLRRTSILRVSSNYKRAERYVSSFAPCFFIHWATALNCSRRRWSEWVFAASW